MLSWHPIITYEWICRYGEAVRATSQVERSERIWGFIDGTFKAILRPKDDKKQRAFYSGYKKAHGFKIQAICTPDGLIPVLDGPYEGRINDYSMLSLSDIEARCEAVSVTPKSAVIS